MLQAINLDHYLPAWVQLSAMEVFDFLVHLFMSELMSSVMALSLSLESAVFVMLIFWV